MLKSSLLLLVVASGTLLTSSAAFSAPIGKIYLAESAQWVDSKAQDLNLSIPGFSIGLNGAPADFRNLVKGFVSENSKVLGVSLTSSLQETAILRSSEMETHRLKKVWNGLEVVGADAVVNLKDGIVVLANADATALDTISATPRISSAEAKGIAFSSYRGRALKADKPELKVLLVGSGKDRHPALTYSVKVVDGDQFSSDVHYIDANSGQELVSITNVQTIADRRVLAAAGTEDDIDVVSDDNADQLMDQKFATLYATKGCGSAPCPTAAPAVQASALSAFTNSGLVLDYYQISHNRNSVDGSGLQIKSVVNFAGDAFKNAAWVKDRKIMLYGMGDASTLNDFASPLDVVAHEITHGVTSNTAGLEYASESGALNESYSDVFGKLVAFKNGRPAEWKIGKDLFKDGTSFIRDMEHPEIAHTKDFIHRGEQCNRFNDQCGVHDNSGIPNRAAVLIANRIGLEKLGKIYFLTLTQLLRSSSDFKEARAQSEAACATLFGRGNVDCRAVSDAFEAVGI